MNVKISKENLFARLKKYCSYETTSSPVSNTHPSSDKEFVLINELKKELEEMGLVDIYVSKYAYLYARLPKNEEGIKPIGFISHVDTSCDANGKDVKILRHDNYDGSDIVLENNTVLSQKEFPFLKGLVSRTLLTTDGNSLMGADDKAGIAEIMESIKYLKENPSIKHGDIYVAFTPDEEIGEGTLYFELDKFPCSFAYTIDGSVEGEISYENFNAASAKVTINGKNIHPGAAKDHMVNSILVAYEFNSMLNPLLRPEKTEGREGFNHLNNMEGNVEKTTLNYIIRNHDKEKFAAQKQSFLSIMDSLNKKYDKNTVEVVLKDSYYNMYDIIKDNMEPVNIAISAIKNAGINPVIEPIRGGTDGATLTFKGLVCPNLGTGGFNFHGKYECITLEGMQKSTEIILNIIDITSKKGN